MSRFPMRARRAPRPGRRRRNPDGVMTIVEHLEELRRRVVISLLAVLLGAVVGFLWYQHSVPGLPTLGDILRGPYCSLPEDQRARITPDGACRLLATSPFEMLKLRMKVGALVGAVLASPVWLGQLWSFITPGLRRGERRWTFAFVGSAVVLFTAGAVLAYVCVAYGLDFLIGMGDEAQVAALTGERYFNFLLALLLIFGVSFEVPLLIVMLNLVGVFRYRMVRGKRSYIIVGLAVFAAAITPGQDPFSMLVLLLALVALVEAALQFSRWNDRRRRRERPDWLDVGDDAASPLDGPAGAGERPEPVAPPRPVEPAARAHPARAAEPARWRDPDADLGDVL